MKYAFSLSTPLILAALVVDIALGDPRWLPHPVRLIGAAISFGDRRLRTGSASQDARNGALLASAVILLSGFLAWAIIAIAGSLSAVLGACVAVVIAWTTLALRGLDSAAAKVSSALVAGDLAAARAALPALVGRDPQRLDRDGIVRAAVESVAENCSDGVIAPLLFLFLGGPVAAITYKAVNTLDSMLGYRTERYLHFGRAAARIDDLVNFVPARLTALLIVFAAELISGRGPQAFGAWRSDAWRHPSPNAGVPEAAMAGALGIQLGGPAFYQGELEHRPLLGQQELPPATEDIAGARNIVRLATASAFCVFAVARFVIANW